MHDILTEPFGFVIGGHSLAADYIAKQVILEAIKRKQDEEALPHGCIAGLVSDSA